MRYDFFSALTDHYFGCDPFESIATNASGAERKLKILLDQKFLGPNDEDSFGTPLLRATLLTKHKKLRAAVAPYLLEKGANPNFTGKDFDVFTGLFLEDNYSRALISLLISYGAHYDDYAGKLTGNTYFDQTAATPKAYLKLYNSLKKANIFYESKNYELAKSSFLSAIDSLNSCIEIDKAVAPEDKDYINAQSCLNHYKELRKKCQDKVDECEQRLKPAVSETSELISKSHSP
jgi:hypothetical protein